MSIRETIRVLRFYYKPNSREIYRKAFVNYHDAWRFPFYGSGRFVPHSGGEPITVPRAQWRSVATAGRLLLMGARPEWSDGTLAITFGKYRFVQPAFERWTPQGIFVDDNWNIFRGEDLTGKVAVDVGAFIGDSSVAYAERGAIVHAFEPIPIFYDFLCRNIELNNMHGRIIPHAVALSDRDEVIRDPKTVMSLASIGHGCLAGGVIANREARVYNLLRPGAIFVTTASRRRIS